MNLLSPISLLSPPGHDPNRRPRRTRLPRPGVLAGLAVEIPAVPGLPDIEPERAAARALRDKGGRQVGGQVRSGRPLGARARRRRRPLSRVPPRRVRWLRVSRLRRKRQQLDHGLVPGGRAAAGLPGGRAARVCPPGSAGIGATGSAAAEAKEAGGTAWAPGAGGSAQEAWAAREPWAVGGAGRRRGAGYRPKSSSAGSPGLSPGPRAGDRNTARTAMPPTTTETITAMVSEVCTKVAAARPPISAAMITSSAQPSWAGPSGDRPTGDEPSGDEPTGDEPGGSGACLEPGLRRPWELIGRPGEAER